MRARSSARGFTLVEVLVALGVAAISLVASLKATGSMVVNNEDMRMRLLATWSAENRLAQLRVERQWPEVGSTQFACDQGHFKFSCKQKITTMPYAKIRGVEVEVFATDGLRVARLVGFVQQRQM